MSKYRRSAPAMMFILQASTLLNAASAVGAPTTAVRENECVKALRILLSTPTKVSDAAQTTRLLARLAYPAGIIAGGANDFVITCLGCAGFLPEAIRPWLPFTNESANIMASATGKRWFYSGLRKKIADGVAMGAIAGHTISAATQHGLAAAGLTAGLELGLTYWFPNKFFHSILHGVPELIPETWRKTQKFAKSTTGQVLIGVSMIVIIEELISHTKELTHMAPKTLKDDPPQAKSAADSKSTANTQHAMAAFLLDGWVSGDDDVAENAHNRFLSYLLGISSNETLFSPKSDALPGVLQTIHLSAAQEARMKELKRDELKKRLGNLLTDREVDALSARITKLLNEATLDSEAPSSHEGH